MQCHQLNVSTCELSESSANFTVVVYNPVASSSVETGLRLPLHPAATSVQVFDSDLTPIPATIVHNTLPSE